MNGYFRVSPAEKSTVLEIFAPTAGGVPVRPNDVIVYLNSKGIKFDPTVLGQIVEKGAKADFSGSINMLPIKPLAESCLITTSQDKMQAYICLYAPSAGGRRMVAEELHAELKAKGIIFGIKLDVIQQILESPVYCEDILIAEGLIPDVGADGYIEYLFNTDRTKKPALREDGSVDFFNLNILQSCGEGQELAKLHKPVKGSDGKAVDGTVVKAREPKAVNFKHGNNVKISEDGLTLIACISGSVSLVGGQVFVNSSMEFDEISTSTGNINFEGDVIIKGNIGTNYEVHAKGDIIVHGLIEAAIVEAGGNIIVDKGINGMGRAVISAGGNIIAKYMENVTATAGGYISSEAIMHSDITAGGDIIVDGRKGVISGGRASAGGFVEVKTLGSEMANDTIIEIGISPLVKREIQELRNQAAEKQKTLESIRPVMSTLAMKVKSGVALTDEQKMYVGKLMATQKTADEELASIMDRLNELEAQFNIDTPSEVRVKGVAYPGSKVCISDVSMVVKNPTKYCKFVKLRGDVKITSYN